MSLKSLGFVRAAVAGLLCAAVGAQAEVIGFEAPDYTDGSTLPAPWIANFGYVVSTLHPTAGSQSLSANWDADTTGAKYPLNVAPTPGQQYILQTDIYSTDCTDVPTDMFPGRAGGFRIKEGTATTGGFYFYIDCSVPTRPLPAEKFKIYFWNSSSTEEVGLFTPATFYRFRLIVDWDTRTRTCRMEKLNGDLVAERTYSVVTNGTVSRAEFLDSQAGSYSTAIYPVYYDQFTMLTKGKIMASVANVNVREAGQGHFHMRLGMAPTTNVTVTVARVAGSTNINILGASTRTFTPTNWDVGQMITLQAPHDPDATDETATFRLSAPDMPDTLIGAATLDDDIGPNLALAASGTGITGGVNPQRLIDGIHTASSNYGYTVWTAVPPGAMVLNLRATATVSRVRLLNFDWSPRTHKYLIESSTDGSTWSSLVDASVGEHTGWEDWAVANRLARYLRFTGLSNSANTAVCIAEWEVYGTRPPLPVVVTSSSNVNVREAGEGRFFVRLSTAPSENVMVTVSRVSGDPNVTVKNGATRTFTPANWNTWQVVTLAAAHDENAASETAIIRVSLPGAPDSLLTAIALDDDVGPNLALAASGSTIAGGSGAAKLIDGVHMSSTNYGYTAWTSVPPGAMTLDLKATATVARIRLLNFDWSYRVHRYKVESSINGTVWSNLVDASAGEHTGWEDWAVADQTARYLRFTGLSNSANAMVCMAEWEVYGARPPLPVVVTSASNVNVREAGEGRFFVRLSAAPSGNVMVTVSRVSGDVNLTVKNGATRTFTPANWNTWQVVTLAAAHDADANSETATFQLLGGGAAAAAVTAMTLDDDIGPNLALAASGSTIAGGASAAKLIDGVHTSSANYGYTVWTAVPPKSMVLDLKAVATVSRMRLLNYDWAYRFQRYLIEASEDGVAWTNLVDASAGEHTGWEDWAVADQTARYLRFTGLSNSASTAVSIAEWEVYGTRPALFRANLAAAPGAGGGAAPAAAAAGLRAGASADAAQPDFIVTAINCRPAAPQCGKPAAICVVVKNQGAAAGDAGLLTIWMDQASAAACGQRGGVSKAVGNLKPGQSRTFLFGGLTAPATAGTRTFRAFVDSRCVTAESDEANNQAVKSYTLRTPGKGNVLVLDGADNGSANTVQVGAAIQVRLPGNPSTGYSWEIASCDESVLIQVGEVKFIADGPRPGQGGTFLFRFKALAQGQTALKLDYRRPWEENPARTFVANLVVQ